MTLLRVNFPCVITYHYFNRGELNRQINAFPCFVVLCGLIELVTFWASGFGLEAIASLLSQRAFARKEKLKRTKDFMKGRRRYRRDFSSKIREKTFKEEKPRMRKISAEAIL